MEEMVEQVSTLLEQNSDKKLRDYLNSLNISDVEELIDELPEHGPKFIETLSVNRAVNVFRILDFPTQERIIKDLSGEKIAQIIKFVQETGGLQYAESQMKKYQDEAFAILNTFPAGDSRTGLEQLVRFTTERNK